MEEARTKTITNLLVRIFSLLSAQRAKELCAAAARAVKEAEQAADNTQAQPTGGLSVEAVAALGTQTGPAASTAGSVTGTQSFMGREGRKTSTIAGARGTGAGKNIPLLQQSPPGTPPAAAPLRRKLSVSASVGGEDGLYSCVLPEDLLVELLAERMQVGDGTSSYTFPMLATGTSVHCFQFGCGRRTCP